MHLKVIRLFDIILASVGLIVLLPFAFLFVPLLYLETGSPFFLQKRLGQGKKPFTLIKLRTMTQGTASVATHLVPPTSVTQVGKYLRASKLDELPQLFNVLSGQMSIVGPRPCLITQHAVVEERQKLNVFSIKPGITGLAQINGIDMSDPSKLAELDGILVTNFSLKMYVSIILQTIIGRGFGDNVMPKS